QRLTGTGSVVFTNGTALVLSNSTPTTFGGVISGDGSLTKIGANVQTLSAASTYSGATRVDDGLLAVSGSLASTNLFVTSGGNFGWDSTAALSNVGAVDIALGGRGSFDSSGRLG